MAEEEKQQTPRVTVADFDMPFWSMVHFMIKAAFASIPAIIAIWIIVAGLGAWLGQIL